MTIPERGRPVFWRTLPAASSPTPGMSLLIGSCFWINDDRDGFYAAPSGSSCSASGPCSRC